MGRVKDLWVNSDGTKTSRHPANGGNKNAKRWQAEWEAPDGKKPTRAFQKKTEAEAHWKKMEADAQRGQYVDPKEGDKLFGPLGKKWLRLSDVGGLTRVRYESTYRNHVEPPFAKRKLKTVKPSDIKEWLNSPEMKALGEGARRVAFIIVRAVFDLAVADKMIHENPTRSRIISPPKVDDPQREPWTVQTVWRVRDEHPELYRPVADCQAGLGARQNEALALAEEDFDFEKMRVHIRRQIALEKGKSYFKAPKENRDRWVPLPRGLAEIIKAHVAAHPPTPYELPWMKEDGSVAADPHVCRLLFRWASKDRRTDGKHVKANLYNDKVWKPALVRAGVLALSEGEKLSVLYHKGSDGNGTHSVRHWYSTTLQDAGVSPVGVTTFMGHSVKSLPVTFRVYGHVTEETFEQARQAIDGTLFRVRPVSNGTVTELRAAQ